jgi:hypothetical protein
MRFVRRERRMLQAQWLFGLFVVVIVIWANFFNSYVKTFETLFLASVVILLGLWPLYRWIGNPGRDAIPVLPMHAGFMALSFGFAGLMPPGQMFTLDWTSEGERQQALVMAGLGLLSLYLGYHLARSIGNSKRVSVSWPLVILPAAYSFLVYVTVPAVLVIKSLVSFAGLNILSEVVDAICTFVVILVIHAAFSGALTRVARRIVLFGLIPYQLIIAGGLAGGTIAGTFVWAVVVGLTYVVTRRRVPYQWILAAAVLVFLLQPIKGEYRALTWGEDVDWSAMKRIQVWVEMGLSYYLDDQSSGVNQVSKGMEKSYDRVNHLMVTAAVIADTPSRQPFLYGESYLPLLTKWIPRLIWPEKPREDLGNRWGRQYGYLGEDDFGTSFNLPWLTEMYMNFGALGVFGVSFLLGVAFRYLSVHFWTRARDAGTYAFGMVIGIPLFFVESNLSLLFGQLIISAISLVIVAYVAARFFPSLFIWKHRDTQRNGIR